MIPRYSRPDMVAIWSPESKFRIWYEIEAHACDAHGQAWRDPGKENAAKRCGRPKTLSSTWRGSTRSRR